MSVHHHDYQSAPCNHCGGTQYRKSLRSPDFRVGIDTPFQLMRCVSCGLVSLQPQPDYETLLPHYPDWIWQNELIRKRGLHPKFQVALTILQRWHPTPGTLLDVGCATGEFILAARALGWQAVGLEIDERQVEVARESGADARVCSDFPSYIRDTKFEAITFNHVLEHVPSPRAYLEKALQLLMPGGILLVSVPNYDSLSRRIYGPYWSHLDLPRHLFHFTPKTLGNLVTAAGGRVVAIHYLDREQDAFGLRNSLGRWLRHGVLKRPLDPEAVAARESQSAQAAQQGPGAESLPASLLKGSSKLAAALTAAMQMADTFTLVATTGPSAPGESQQRPDSTTN